MLISVLQFVWIKIKKEEEQVWRNKFGRKSLESIVKKKKAARGRKNFSAGSF